jgi:anti-sigma B factor antagonist
MDEPLVRVAVEREDDERIVASIRGDIDLSNAEDVGRALRASAMSAPSHMLVVDLREVTYIDSQGLRMLHKLASRLIDRDAAVAVVAPRGSVAGDVMRLTGIDRYVSLVEDLDGSTAV